MDNKLKSIIERRKFSNFWEAFDYLKLASYSEIDALMMASDLFNGNIWGDVISAQVVEANSLRITGVSSGITTTSVFNMDDEGTIRFGNDRAARVAPKADGDLTVKIFYLTKDANKNYKDLYKSYIEIEKYEKNKELDAHIGSITTELKTELAIKLFRDGQKKLN